MIPLDSIDYKILQVLQLDAGISNLELAERVNLSPSPCARRVKQLEDAGVIERRVALLSPKALGLGLTVYIMVALERHTRDQFALFEAEILLIDEVVECSLITGQSADYLLKVMVPDLDYFQRFLLDRLTRIEVIREVNSSFVLRSPIAKTQLPLHTN